jgi:hypothetical protein
MEAMTYDGKKLTRGEALFMLIFFGTSALVVLFVIWALFSGYAMAVVP